MGEAPQPSPKEANLDVEQTPEIPQLRDGLSAVYMPDLGPKMLWGLPPEYPSQEATLKRLNGFLGKLNEQGADMVGVMPVEVAEVREPKQVAIVRKTPQNR